MSQPTTICRPDRIRLPQPRKSRAVENATCPAWKRSASFVGNSLWEVAVAALMIVLAPLAIISLATAFLVACFKMQWNDAGSITNHEIRATAPRLPFDLVAARSG